MQVRQGGKTQNGYLIEFEYKGFEDLVPSSFLVKGLDLKLVQDRFVSLNEAEAFADSLPHFLAISQACTESKNPKKP